MLSRSGKAQTVEFTIFTQDNSKKKKFKPNQIILEDDDSVTDKKDKDKDFKQRKSSLVKTKEFTNATKDDV